jgi:heavy metal sensor kinase
MIDRLPLRLRLTMWFSLVFAIALFSLGFGCLWMLHRATLELEKNELQQRVRSVRRFLEAHPDHPSVVQLRDAMTADYEVSHGNKWLQVIDERGNWLYRSPHVIEAYPQLALPQQIAKSEDYFTYTSGALHVRALIEPITVNGISYTVQTGLTLNKTLAILSDFNFQLSLLTVLGLLSSMLAGYFMSRKALSPIAAIASEAQRINDRSLNNRLPELQTRDELAMLSTTLNQMLGRIESGYQSVRSFTANAAHELRTPLALLRAETELALSFPRDTVYYRETCEKVLEHSLQMSRLTDQLLMLARADAGAEVLRLEPMELVGLIEELEQQWAELFAAARIDFSMQSEGCEMWVNADYLAMKRLLNILLENAWRYTPSGGAVALTMQRSAQSAEICVADTGIGISEAAQSRIFERFSRAAQPLRGDFPGSGLGLALAQWIAERHSSLLTVSSAVGAGSRFTFRLRESSTLVQRHSPPGAIIDRQIAGH